MKKVLTLFVAVAILLLLVACGVTETKKDGEAANNKITSEYTEEVSLGNINYRIIPTWHSEYDDGEHGYFIGEYRNFNDGVIVIHYQAVEEILERDLKDTEKLQLLFDDILLEEGIEDRKDTMVAGCPGVEFLREEDSRDGIFKLKCVIFVVPGGMCMIEAGSLEKLNSKVEAAYKGLLETISYTTNKNGESTDTNETEESQNTMPSTTPPTSKEQPIETKEETGTAGQFQYTVLEENSVEITKYTGSNKNVAIPSEIDGKNVARIGKGAFENSTTIESLAIFAEIEIIDDKAFKGCTSLKKISISYETKEIGKSAFENCISLEEVILWTTETIGESAFKDCTSLKKISIPYETKEIGKSAFENCISLEEVTLWATEAIGESAFRGCTSLEKVTIPYDTKVIGSYAFYDCTSLKEVSIWNSDTELGTDVFGNCPILEK